MEGSLQLHRPVLFARANPLIPITVGTQLMPKNLPRMVRRWREYARQQRVFKREVANNILDATLFKGETPSMEAFDVEFRPSFTIESKPDNKNPSMLHIMVPVTSDEIVRSLRGTLKTAAGPLKPQI